MADLGRALINAATDGQLEAVQTLLGQGADFEARGGCLSTPLHLAAGGGHVRQWTPLSTGSVYVCVFLLFLLRSGTSSAINSTLSTTATLSFFRVLACLRDTPHLADPSAKKILDSLGARTLSTPELQSHYDELLVNTEPYRRVPVHSASGYHGPWLENHFISHFLPLPLTRFAGLVPLFVQWTDIHVHELLYSSQQHWSGKGNASVPAYRTLFATMAQMLRTDVVYLTVSQDDDGLGALMKIRPNVLVLSAGGYGHVALPLIKGELPYVPPPPPPPIPSSAVPFPQLVGFYGQPRPRLARAGMLQEVQSHLPPGTCRVGPSDQWQALIAGTLFNLAPRGFGRTSYRLAEVIQVGRVPVYLYDDYAWLPFAAYSPAQDALVMSSTAPFPGLASRKGHAKALSQRLLALASNHTAVADLLAAVKAVRERYTYGGALRDIEAFLRGEPPLTCTRLPDRSH